MEGTLATGSQEGAYHTGVRNPLKDSIETVACWRTECVTEELISYM